MSSGDSHSFNPDRPHSPVLIVEDDADLREMMAQLLTLEGFRAEAVANGREALTYLQQGDRPDLILLDLMMPVMDGYDFYSHRRKLPGAHPPVIVVSAVAPMRNALPGIHATLPKPFDFTQLLHRVQAAVNHSAAAN